jgi:hypothetical protein
MREAIRARARGCTFTCDRIPTSYKFDLFPAASDFRAVELQRARAVPVKVPLANAGRSERRSTAAIRL